MEQSILELDDLLTTLEGASRVNDQRNACKAIQNWLFDERNRASLDAVAADSQVSWKSVISVVLTLVEEAGKVQKFHLDLLRDCLQGAGQISGIGTYPYADRVSKHVCHALQAETTPFKMEYFAIYSLLIKNRLFRASLTGTNLRKLIDQSIVQIRHCVETPDFQNARQDQARRELLVHLEALASITRELHRDDQLAAGLIAQVFDTLEDVGTALQNGTALSERTLLATRLVECIAELFLHFALDYQERAARLLRSIADLIGMSWGQGMDLLKVGFVQCLRIAMAAGIDLDSRIVSDSFDRVQQEIFRLKEGVADSRCRLSKEAFYLMDLCAEMTIMRVQKKVDAGGDVLDQPSQPNPKRARAETTADWLLNSVFGQQMDRPKPSVPWMQFLCLFLSKHRSALDTISHEMRGSIGFGDSVLKRLEVVLSRPIDDDTVLIWLAQCLTVIVSCTGPVPPRQTCAAMLPLLRTCLELAKVRAKRTDGLVATSALLRAVRVALVRRFIGVEWMAENGDTVWQILISIWGGVCIAPTRTPGTLGRTDNESAQNELLRWTSEILKNFALSDIKRAGRIECPRDNLLTMVLERARAACDTVERAQYFSTVILALICGSSSSSRRLLPLVKHRFEDEYSVERARYAEYDSACFYSMTRLQLFGLKKGVDPDSYTWLIDEEGEESRFERILDSLAAVTKLSSRPDKGQLDISSLTGVEESSQPISQIFIPVAHVERMRASLLQFFGGASGGDVQTSQAVPGADEVRILLLVGILQGAKEFADAGEALVAFLHPLVLASIQQDSSAAAPSSQHLNLHLWPLIDCLDGMNDKDKVIQLSKIGFLACTLASMAMRDDFQELRSGIKSFLQEVCRACACMWNHHGSSSLRSEDDGFSAGDLNRLQTEYSLRVEPLFLFLKLFATGQHGNPESLVRDLSVLFQKDDLENAFGLRILVKKLEVLSSVYSHPALDEIYLGALERLMPSKKGDDFKHHRKLIVLNAIRVLASHFDNSNDEFDQEKIDATMMRSGQLLDKYLEAHSVLIKSQPPKQLQRDIRRILCRTLGQVLAAIKQPNLVYVEYILNCLNDDAFEVRHEAVVACPTFFSTWDSPTPIMGQILEKLPSNADVSQKRKAVILTHIQALAKIGSLPEQFSNSVVEGHSIYLLCEFYHRFPALKCQVESALLSIAASANLERSDLVKMHLHSILCKWTRAGRHWKNFPYFLAGFQSLQDFALSSVAMVLAPEYILFDGESVGGTVINAQSHLNEIALHSGFGSWYEMCKESYPMTMACLLQLCCPLQISADEDEGGVFRDTNCLAQLTQQAKLATESIALYFTGYKGPGDLIDDVLLCALNNLISGLQLAACRNFDSRDSYIFSINELESTVVFCVQKLASNLKMDPTRLLLGGSSSSKVLRKDRLQLLILHCRRHLNEGRKMNIKLRSLAAIRVLLHEKLMGDISSIPWFFHHIVDVLLLATLQPSVSLEAASLFQQVILQSLNKHPERIYEGSFVTRTICAFIPLAQRESADSNNIFIQLINTLAENCCCMSNFELQSLPPFPHDSIFDRAVDICSQFPNTHTFDAFLKNFDSVDEHISLIMKDAYLSHLLSFLQSDEFLTQILPSLQRSNCRPARQLLNKLMEMAQQLVSTSNAAATVNTKHLLGRCIAYSFAALLPIHAYSPHETTFILPLLCGSGRRGSRLPDQLSLCGVGAMMVKILKCYIETEEVYSVAEAASDLLKDLFRSDSPWRADLLLPSSALDQHVKDFLEPYITDIGTGVLQTAGMQGITEQLSIEDDKLWLCEGSYETWICRVSEALCWQNTGHPVWPRCARLCKLKASFAESLFPHLLFEIFLTCRNRNCNDVNSALSRALQASVLIPTTANIAAVRTVVRALEFFNAFRCYIMQNPISSFTDEVLRWKTCYWFDIPYLTAAQAALRCRAPLTSFLFLERLATSGTLPKYDSAVPVLHRRSEVEVLMMKVYQDIDESDGNAAFDKGLDLSSVASAYERDEEWWRALGLFDVSIMEDQELAGDSPMESRLFRALNNSGLPYLSSTVASWKGSSSRVSPEVFFEASWRAERWGNTTTSTAPQDTLNSHAHNMSRFHNSIHQILSMCNFRSFGDPNLNRHLDEARLAAMNGFGMCSLQSLKSVLPSMVSLRMVEDISCTLNSMAGDSHGRVEGLQNQVSSWELWYRSMMHNDFKYLEPALALHTILLKLVGDAELQQEHLCSVAKIAMKCDNLSYARSMLYKVQTLNATEGVDLGPKDWWLWLAKLYWRDGKRDRASSLLNSLQEHLKISGKDTDQPLLARVLALNASWCATTRSKGWEEIMETFKKSVEIKEDANCRAKLASFMDSLYSAEQGQADELKKQLKELGMQRIQLEEINRVAVAENEKEIKKVWTQRHKNLLFHEANLKERIENKKHFLRAALENYLLCIDSAKKAGQAVFRVLHLWFEGHDDDEVNKIVLQGLTCLQSCKAFKIIVPQVISRLDSKDTAPAYQEAVWYLVTRLLHEAPQELLFHIFAAQNEERAQLQIKTSNVSVTINTRKVQAARDILSEFQKSKGLGFDAFTLLDQATQLANAYMELADHRQEECELNQEYPLTNLLKRLKWTQQISQVVVPTYSSSCPDDVAPKVSSFTGWTYPGGITKPKKITCYSTDGRSFLQVVKGGEDPRADSVTSQLFCVINLLLMGNRGCRRRKLEVRTYKVIPLHPQAGLIEWVSDAPSLGSILGCSTNPQTYSQSLHGRYDPLGWTHKTCCDRVNAVQNIKGKRPNSFPADCLKSLEEVFANTNPVFRHYFFDRSSSASQWFQLRLTYSRSVAASSIAGFVVGLGDRHTNNILVLERTGEVVHIDLGIVFDQGRLLPMPELIPFRLTRDIVDGMGVAGTAGVFTRCCEETLHVLRENRQALLAVVDVLMHDPLSAWKMCSSKKASAQRRSLGPTPAVGDLEEEGSGISVDASFVRSRVKEKLEGWDRGELLSVEGQVKKLICDAQSMENLSQLFRGWSAWL